MIIFFYGQDDYRIAQQTKKLKEKFISASLGDTNLVTLEAKTLTYAELMRQIMAMPFLSKTRLVIVQNILSEVKKDVQEQIGENLTKVPASTVLVFSETKPDKRLSLYKKLIKVDKVQEFKLLEDDQLRRFIKNEVEIRGGKIESDGVAKLVDYIGPDLWRMTNEIAKLTAYSPQLTAENIELLVSSKIEKDIFRLVDAIGNKNLKSALRESENLQKAGENELYILTMMVYQYRNLLIIKDLQERGIHSSWDIAKKSALNPYVVSKTLYQTKNFTFDDLKNAYKNLLDFDIKIKTGKIDGKTAINVLLAKFCI